ncbi:MAG: hypothetical protein K2N74_02790, partial [Clostridiales bacterium]|nr:hypothetical protein [Clostridiales bacterium]
MKFTDLNLNENAHFTNSHYIHHLEVKIMSKNNQSGVFQLPNGFWCFRYRITVNGKVTDVRKTKDEFGQVLKTEKSAIRARELSIRRTIETRHKNANKPRMTVKELYKEYCETGRSG